MMNGFEDVNFPRKQLISGSLRVTINLFFVDLVDYLSEEREREDAVKMFSRRMTTTSILVGSISHHLRSSSVQTRKRGNACDSYVLLADGENILSRADL